VSDLARNKPVVGVMGAWNLKYLKRETNQKLKRKKLKQKEKTETKT